MSFFFFRDLQLITVLLLIKDFYQYSMFHVWSDKNQSIINWWLSIENTKL